MSRMDTNHSSSVCTRSLVEKRTETRSESRTETRPTVSTEHLERAIRVRDAYESSPAAPGRIGGPKLEDLQPRFCAPPPSLRDATGSGYAQRIAGTRASQQACLEHVEKLHGSLRDIKLQYTEWKAANPNAREPSDGELTMGQILELPVHEQCVRILCIVIHERPETIDECRHAGSSHEPNGCGHGDEPRFGIPSGEIPGQVAGPAPSAPTAPTAPTAATAPSAPAGGDFLSEMGKMFGPLASMLGGLLQNPAVIGILAAASLLIPPPVGPIVALAIPLIAPLAGMLLQGLGGAMGGAPAPGAPGAAPGGFDLNALMAMVSGLGGMFGATGATAGAAPAPVPVT